MGDGSIIFGDSIVLFSAAEVKEMQERSFSDDKIIIGKVVGDGEVLCISKISQKFIRCAEEILGKIEG